MSRQKAALSPPRTKATEWTWANAISFEMINRAPLLAAFEQTL